MKKTLLALAITALSANAFAVNLNTGAETESYASEIKVNAAGTVINGTNATVSAGFALGTDGYARFNLSNGAKFKGDPVLTTSGLSVFTVAGGGNNADYVIFKTDGKGTTIGETLTLALAADVAGPPAVKNGLTVVNKGAVSVSYSLYETAGNATNQTGALASKSGTLLNFAPALAVSAVSATPLEIDAIRHESKKFVSGLTGTETSPLVTLSVAVVPGTVPSDVTGTPIAAASDIINAATSKWSLTGNFSAAAASGAVTTAVGANSFTVAQDKQSAELADLSKATGTVSYKVSGTAEIAETPIAATFTPVALEGYEVTAKTLGDITRLQKNGTTVPVNLALKPGGAYSNFVRVSNTDTISGTIFIKVINDAGKAVSFPLSAVAGQPASLAAGASTTQLSIQSIYDAAVAKDATFATSGEGKLRLEITGQTAGLSVQSYTVSKDGNSFATF